MPTRRRVLGHVGALGAAASLGGCFWDTTNDSFLAVRLEPVPRADLGQNEVVAEEELGPRAGRIVDEGLANGTSAYGRQPHALTGHAFVRDDGTYYAVRRSENGTETVERPVLEAEPVETADGSVSDRGNLSESDGRALRCAVSTADERDPHPCVVHEGEASAFWPESRFRYLERGDDGYFRLSVSERNVSLDRHEYRFEPVAGNRSAFADYAAGERVAVDFSTVDASAEQREILRTAAEEGVYEESPPPYSDGLRDLTERIRGASDGYEAIVRFDGAYYLASVEQGFDD